MSNMNRLLTPLRPIALVLALTALSACATTNYANNPDDFYSNIYKSPPTSTLNQDLHIFSNGDLL